jgi:protoheme IX farnesyltransferase
MVGGILYEHGHRMIAALVGLMILGLAVWMARVETRRWVRLLGYATLGAVMLQGLLGGLTVLLLLPPAISIAHACLGQTVWCLTVSIAFCTSSRGRTAAALPPAPTNLRRGSLAVAALAFFQLVSGAVVRHTGAALLPHALVVSLLMLLSGWLLYRAWRSDGMDRRVRSHALRLLTLIGAQLLLGVTVWLHRSDVVVRTTHVAVGALILAQAVVLVWELFHGRLTVAVDFRGQAPHFRGQAPSSLVLLKRCLTPTRFLDYLELTKPRLSALVLVTTAAGFWLGMRSPRAWTLLWPTLLGTALAAGGANALNQWGERAHDALMQRTRSRPLPAGRLRPIEALWFGTALVGGGIAFLTLSVNGLAGSLAALSAATYLFWYTPLKRSSSLCTLVGAIPGALPPLIGWAAARGSVGVGGWTLFAVLFLWQLPHFLAIAILYQEDYARAGFRMLPLLEPGGGAAARQMTLYGLCLVPVSLFPTLLGLTGVWYFCGALALSSALLVVALRAALTRSAVACRQLFLASLLYLPLLLALLALDKRRIV